MPISHKLYWKPFVPLSKQISHSQILVVLDLVNVSKTSELPTRVGVLTYFYSEYSYWRDSNVDFEYKLFEPL